MKRRGFLTKLLLGTIAVPSVAKAVVEEPARTTTPRPLMINGQDPRWESYDRYTGRDANGTLVEEVVEHGRLSTQYYSIITKVGFNIPSPWASL